eukprot:Hpha_TRINITY_DN13201_c0_g1::TRINITY_DN13201_c0_g1_i1::g.154824::m.154824
MLPRRGLFVLSFVSVCVAEDPPACAGETWSPCNNANNRQTRSCLSTPQERWCLGARGADDYCQQSSKCPAYEGGCSSGVDCSPDLTCFHPQSRKLNAASQELYTKAEWEAAFPTASWDDALQDPLEMYKKPLCVPLVIAALGARQAAKDAEAAAGRAAFVDAQLDATCPSGVVQGGKLSSTGRTARTAEDPAVPCPLLTEKPVSETSLYNPALLGSDAHNALKPSPTNPFPSAAKYTSHWEVFHCAIDAIATKDRKECRINKETHKIDLAEQINAKLSANGKTERVPKGMIRLDWTTEVGLEAKTELDLKAPKVSFKASAFDLSVVGWMIVDTGVTTNSDNLNLNNILDEILGTYTLPLTLPQPVLRAFGADGPLPVAGWADITPTITIDKFQLQSVPADVLAPGSRFRATLSFEHKISLVPSTHMAVTVDRSGIYSQAGRQAITLESPPTLSTSTSPEMQFDLDEGPKHAFKVTMEPPPAQPSTNGGFNLAGVSETTFDIRITVGSTVRFGLNGYGTASLGPIGAQAYARGTLYKEDATECWKNEFTTGVVVPKHFAASLADPKDLAGETAEIASRVCVQSGAGANVAGCTNAIRRIVELAQARGMPSGSTAPITAKEPSLPSKPSTSEPASSACISDGTTSVAAEQELQITYSPVDGETDAQFCSRVARLAMETTPSAKCGSATPEAWVERINKLVPCPRTMQTVTEWVPDHTSSGPGVQCYVCGHEKIAGQSVKIGACPGQSALEKSRPKLYGLQRCCYDPASVLISPDPSFQDFYHVLGLTQGSASTQNEVATALASVPASDRKKGIYGRANYMLGKESRRTKYNHFYDANKNRSLHAGSPWEKPLKPLSNVPWERLQRCHCGFKGWQEKRPPYSPPAPPKEKLLGTGTPGRRAESLDTPPDLPVDVTHLNGPVAASKTQMKQASPGGETNACLNPALAHLLAGKAPYVDPAPVAEGPTVLSAEEAAAQATEKQKQRQKTKTAATAPKAAVEGEDEWQCGPLRERL